VSTRDPNLLRFLAQLGSAMNAAGESAPQADEHLRTIARRFGAPTARVSVLPSLVFVALGPGEPPTLEERQWLGGPMRLDQTQVLYELVDEAKQGVITPTEGLERLHAIVASPPPRGWPVLVLGVVVLTTGLSLVLRATPRDLLAAVAFGLVVGLLDRVTARSRSLQVVMPFLAAAGVSAATFALAEGGTLNTDYQAIIPPLVTFLPGVTLMVGLVELGAGESIAGASRVAAGTLMLLLLAVGIVAGTALVGPETEPIAATAGRLGTWAPWVGVLVFAVGMLLYFSGRLSALPWLLVVLYGGWIGQLAGNALVGGYLSGFVGGLVITPLAFAVQRRPSAPPALVTLVPGFWLLVPGAIGLLGLTKVLGDDRTASVDDLGRGFGGILAIAIGALCGYSLLRWRGARAADG
jgi:uncharacterized membrane protein YjjP (DUF1212 family)